jgi:hypothetical protein
MTLHSSFTASWPHDADSEYEGLACYEEALWTTIYRILVVACLAAWLRDSHRLPAVPDSAALGPDCRLQGYRASTMGGVALQRVSQSDQKM